MYIVNGAVLERWSSLTDERIVAHVVAGQTALFELLMRRHNDQLYGAARAVLRDDHEAEDVMQLAYVKAYAHLRQFDGHTRFATWLTGIVINEVLARLRCRHPYRQLDIDGKDMLEPAMETHARADTFRQTRSDRVVAAVLRRIE